MAALDGLLHGRAAVDDEAGPGHEAGILEARKTLTLATSVSLF
jgi:hypothetical protein